MLVQQVLVRVHKHVDGNNAVHNGNQILVLFGKKVVQCELVVLRKQQVLSRRHLSPSSEHRHPEDSIVQLAISVLFQSLRLQ